MAHHNQSSIVDDAMRFALDAHAGMVRKGRKIPYILHPMEVATIASTMTDDPEVIAAALLHDIVEDTGHTLDEIEQRFGGRVARIVDSETEEKHSELPPEATWQVRKQESLERLARASRDEKIVWLSDKLSNMRSFHRMYLVSGSALWNTFHQSDPVKQAWYYTSISQLCDELASEPAWQEYDRLIHIVFEGII